MGSADIWLCHNCGDCTTLCPRGAKPGDVLSAIRAYAVREYATPSFLSKAVANPKMLPVLLAIPAVIFIVLGLILKAFGVNWFTFPFPDGEIWQGHFINNYLVDVIMVPTFFGAIAVFALGLKRFLADIHGSAVAQGKAVDEKIDIARVVKALLRVVLTVFQHKKFKDCSENQNRAPPLSLVLARIRPPKLSMMRRLMARPMPSPPVRVV